MFLWNRQLHNFEALGMFCLRSYRIHMVSMDTVISALSVPHSISIACGGRDGEFWNGRSWQDEIWRAYNPLQLVRRDPGRASLQQNVLGRVRKLKEGRGVGQFPVWAVCYRGMSSPGSHQVHSQMNRPIFGQLWRTSRLGPLSNTLALKSSWADIEGLWKYRLNCKLVYPYREKTGKRAAG